MTTKKKILPHNKQLRQHMITIHAGHLFAAEPGYSLWTMDETNFRFQTWFDEYKSHNQPDYLKYLAFSLELIPEKDKHGNPNQNAGYLHINGCLFWKKPVRLARQIEQLGLPMTPSTQQIGNPVSVIDYCTCTGSYAVKQHVEIWEYCPTGVRPYMGQKSRQAVTDLMIDMVNAGLSVKQMWASNPRVVAHFGVLRLNDFVQLRKELEDDSEGSRPLVTPKLPKEVPKVTGFLASDTDALLPRHPSRVYRGDSVDAFERYTRSDVSHLETQHVESTEDSTAELCFTCGVVGQDSCHLHGSHMREEE